MRDFDGTFPYEVHCPVCGASVLSMTPETGSLHTQIVPQEGGPGYAIIRSLNLQTVIHRCDESIAPDFVE